MNCFYCTCVVLGNVFEYSVLNQIKKCTDKKINEPVSQTFVIQNPHTTHPSSSIVAFYFSPNKQYSVTAGGFTGQRNS